MALAALCGDKTANQLASEYDVYSLLVSQWNKTVVTGLTSVFASRHATREKTTAEPTASLYQQIGPLKVELGWVTENRDSAVETRRGWIEPDLEAISVRQQCALLGVEAVYPQPRLWVPHPDRLVYP